MDDADGIAADLDARMALAVAAYRDPWPEGGRPAETGRFRTALPLISLPRVPIRDGSTSVGGG